MQDSEPEVRPGLAETHISVLFFVGERVYKLKKPVSTGFLDFTSREARRTACHREVELNRRLAPDVYLGVLDVLGPDGQPCDHLVAMRRLPDNSRLATLVRDRAEVSAGIRQLAHLLAAFHERAATSPEIATAASQAAVLQNWEDNFAQMARFQGTIFDAQVAAQVAELARRYIAGRGALFERRAATGMVRDGHGDLLAEDIFLLPDGPRVLDCIEFDDRLRHGDVLADVAFLAMDLERLGAADLGRRFLDWYVEFSGHTHPASLAEHYVAYRAHVRAKVACLRYEQGLEAAAAEARLLLDLSLRHLKWGRVRLVLVGGLPGTGKTTLANALADTLGWSLFSSDEVRRDQGRRAGAVPYGTGSYGEESLAGTYTEMLARAGIALALGESVILDASWRRGTWRRWARQLASERWADVVELQCRAPLDVAVARLAGRRSVEGGLSDATPAVAEAMAHDFEPWPEAREVDTGGAPTRSLEQALDAVL